jgi:hypothetical protein
VNIPRVIKYSLMAIAVAAVLELALMFLGHWLNVRIPRGVTIGLLIGVVAWFANQLQRASR